MQDGALSAKSTTAGCDHLGAYHDGLPVAHWACATDLVVRKCGGAGWHRLGMMPGEIVGMSVEDLFRGTADATQADALHRNGLAGRSGELVASWAGGWWRFQVRPIKNDGKVVGVATVATDCSSEVALQESLEDRCRKHRLMVDQVAAYLAHADHLERITLCNRRFADLFGKTTRELEMVSLRQAMGTDYYQPLEAAVSRAAGGEEARLTIACKTDGEDCWFEVILTPDQDQTRKKQRSGFVLLMRDVTQRVLDERRKRDALDKFNSRMRLESLGMMAAGVAHDFNNLLAEISGHAGLGMMELDRDSDGYSSLEQISDAARRAADLCKQLMLYSGGGELTLVPLHVQRVLANNIKDARGLLGSGIVLEAAIPSDLPEVSGNVVELRRMFANLIRNACEAMGDTGHLRITAEARYCDQAELDESVSSGEVRPGQFVVVEIADNGCGMSETVQEHLLEPFFTTKETGHGLGIASVLGAARSHGGTLRIDSEEGEGTTFHIYLPTVFR
jgi:PAS domain S-box-containing protein